MRLKILSTILLSVYVQFSIGQKIHNKVNTIAAESYFAVVEELKEGKNRDSISWNKIFSTEIYKMMISGQAVDTNVFKNEMIRVYYKSASSEITQSSKGEQYHKLYDENLENLKKYLLELKQTNIEDSVKLILYPYLPSRLHSDNFFPTIYYIFFGVPEATGYGGLVINDLLFSSRIDNYKFGLVTAHEAFHSIVSTAFQNKLKKEINFNETEFNLLYFLQNISEEGIADLIDKPILLKEKSPVYQQVKELTKDDELLSKKYILSLDSMLKLSLTTDIAINKYKRFSDFASAFGKNGGHIPGRFMGDIIRKSGLLKNHIENIEDPTSFFKIYTQAVKLLSEDLPYFSKESLEYLDIVKQKYFQ